MLSPQSHHSLRLGQANIHNLDRYPSFLERQLGESLGPSGPKASYLMIRGKELAALT